MAKGWGQRLKDRARELGLADVDVARRLGIPQQRYSSYANEIREPHFAEFIRICAALGTTPDVMLGVVERSPDDLLTRRAVAALETMTPALRQLSVRVLETMAAPQPEVEAAKKVRSRATTRSSSRKS